MNDSIHIVGLTRGDNNLIFQEAVMTE